RYLIEGHAPASRRWVGIDDGSAAAPAAIRPSPSVRKALTSNSGPIASSEPIAVIGMSGRYPGAPDLDRFWENLARGADTITDVPADRWALDGFFTSDPKDAVARGMSYAKWGGFLDGFADFD